MREPYELYRKFCLSTVKATNDKIPIYCTLKLVGEFGETRTAIIEGNKNLADQKTSLVLELGDMLWYITVMMNHYDLLLEDAMTSILMNHSHVVVRKSDIGSDDNYYYVEKQMGECCDSVCALSEYVGKCFVKETAPETMQMRILLRDILLKWSRLVYFTISDFEYIMRANETKLRSRMEKGTILVTEKRKE